MDEIALSYWDWGIMIGFFILIITIGLSYTKKAGKDMESFFLGGRNLPWYIAGISMVATTFAADTPLAVTELVGQKGIAGNWLWWSFLAGGMLTTFFFARLWRNSGVLTEVELSELRYSGQPASFLRGFKSVYLGIFMNVIIIAWVNVALMTILDVFFGLEETLIWGLPASLVITAGAMLWTAFYSSLSGLMGVAITDVIQFCMAMTGTIILAYLVINSDQIGGIEGMKAQLPEASLNFLPTITDDTSSIGKTFGLSIGAFLSFAAVQWWASWYPGAEPGGGGYVAQRMMSAKSPRDSVYATLFFQIAHYCIRPWPWILVGVSCLVLYNFDAALKSTNDVELQQEITQLRIDSKAFGDGELIADKTFTLDKEDIEELAEDDKFVAAHLPRIKNVNERLLSYQKKNKQLDESMQYVADNRKGFVFCMKEFLPNGFKGLIGLLLISFFAAYMSTISTQLNWGSSYIVNDLYKRFIVPDANQKDLVFASRVTTFLLMILGLVVSTFVTSISDAWGFLMQCGAGLGLVLILRWYWWRINAWSEITAMIAPILPTAYFAYTGVEFPDAFLLTVLFTTIAWLVVTMVTSPTNNETLQHFYNKVRPDGAWKDYPENYQIILGSISETAEAPKNNLLFLFLCWITAIIMTYSILFLIGKLLLQEWNSVYYLTAIVVVSFVALRFFISRTRVFA